MNVFIKRGLPFCSQDGHSRHDKAKDESLPPLMGLSFGLIYNSTPTSADPDVGELQE